MSGRTDIGGWLIERGRKERFSFDGGEVPFHPGDSLASALLAADRRVVARSFKLHRPRGVMALGAGEPNALLTLGEGGRLTPNARATVVPARDGLVARSQNAWPNAKRDVFGLLDTVRAVLPAGFYYKTFMWPASQWMRYEKYIRKMAGLGPAPTDRDPDRYAHAHAHTDVLVAGGGPAGLSAALAAAETGADVMLCHSGAAFGGGLHDRPDGPRRVWLAETLAKLGAMPNVTLLSNATVAGAYEHRQYTVAERLQDRDPASKIAERFWHVRADKLVIATGATERPMLFADNDRPGVMLAGAARGYLWRYGVRVAEQPVIAGADDSIYRLARELREAGAQVQAIVDLREEPPETDGFRVISGAMVGKAIGRQGVTGAEVWRADGAHMIETVACDGILTTAGFGPNLQLHAQARGKLDWDDALGTFVPGAPGCATIRSAGAANAVFDLDGAIADGRGDSAARYAETQVRPWDLPNAAGGPRFVDFQNDVADKDIALAAREGYRSIEHVKRYTTLGMGTDQGKAAGPVGLALLAAATGKEIADTGVTTFRPPATPVTFGAVSGGVHGEAAHAIRRTAADPWHAEANANFTDAGLWRRPRFYPANGKTLGEAYVAEAKAVRQGVGAVDVSTLGKIDVSGPDAAILMDRLYSNRMGSLKVGRGRYGLMLREDGRVFDDGVVFRLDEERFHLTCTTGGASAVYQHIEHALQILWPDVNAFATPVTEQWFAVAIAGPKSRALLADLLKGVDVSNDALKMMGMVETEMFGQPLRVMRMSYSGELSYELNIPADYGLALWRRIVETGKAHRMTVYGTEAMGALRIEKGHVTHAEADGRTTPADLGLGGMVSKAKDSIGKAAQAFPALQESGRKQLVGLIAERGGKFPVGAQVTADDRGDEARPSLGHVSSYAYSTELGRDVALALIKDGRGRIGQKAFAVSPVMGQSVAVDIVDPVFIDPEGERLRG